MLYDFISFWLQYYFGFDYFGFSIQSVFVLFYLPNAFPVCFYYTVILRIYMKNVQCTYQIWFKFFKSFQGYGLILISSMAAVAVLDFEKWRISTSENVNYGQCNWHAKLCTANIHLWLTLVGFLFFSCVVMSYCTAQVVRVKYGIKEDSALLASRLFLSTSTPIPWSTLDSYAASTSWSFCTRKRLQCI